MVTIAPQLDDDPLSGRNAFAGDAGNGDKVGHQDDQGAIGGLSGQKIPHGIQAGLAILRFLVKRVQGRQLGHRTKIHQFGGLDAAAPLTGIDPGRGDTVFTQPITDLTCLAAAGLIEVALGGAIADFEVRRISAARGQGVADHQNMATLKKARGKILGHGGLGGRGGQWESQDATEEKKDQVHVDTSLTPTAN
jgi:hypothetical protein